MPVAKLGKGTRNADKAALKKVRQVISIRPYCVGVKVYKHTRKVDIAHS